MERSSHKQKELKSIQHTSRSIGESTYGGGQLTPFEEERKANRVTHGFIDHLRRMEEVDMDDLNPPDHYGPPIDRWATG